MEEQQAEDDGEGQAEGLEMEEQRKNFRLVTFTVIIESCKKTLAYFITPNFSLRAEE